MSLGHWCFGLHCHMFTRFFGHWVETCHCAEFRFFELKKLRTEALEDCLNSLNVFFSSNHCPDRCPLSSSTTRPLQSTMATVTAATAGRTEQHSAVTDRGLTDFPLGRFNQLVANTLRVPALGYESVSATEMLAPTLPEFEAAQINDLYCWSLKLSLPWELTVRHWRALHWAKNGFRRLPYLAAWLMDCMGFVMQSLVQTVPATVFHWQHCIPADVRTGRHWRMRRHCFPTARCTPPTHWRSSTAMANVDLRLWRSWLDWLSKVMWSPLLARLHKACALRPHWALPRRSWILDWFLWNCSLTPKWTTGFAQGLHCWGHCRSTGQVILTHWMFRNRWHWSSTILDWRGILPRPLFMDWRATGLTLKEGLKRTLTSIDCTWTTAGLLDHSNWVFSWTLRSPALDSGSYCPSLSRNWWSHCRWNWTATRSLVCTAEDWLDTASSLWISWNWCMKMWALNVPGCTCSLMRNCQRKLEADWQLLMEKLALPRSMWRSLDCLLDLRRWLWLSLVTEIEYTHVIFEATVFEHWSLGSRFTEEAHLHTAPRLIDTVQLITDCVFHWLASIVDHCMHVQVCDTDSLNQCQGEVLRYMHCTHTTAHSNDTVKHTHCLAQVTDKKADWVYTGLTWIAHC